LEISGRGIARGGYAVFAEDKKIGHVTTGYLLPNHERPLALALIQTPYATIGSEVAVLIRNQPVSAIVRDMKFMEKKYMR
jgi:aminomethyltransferase